MEDQNEFNLKKLQSETLEEFLILKANYGLKNFYKTDDKEIESKINEEFDEEIGFVGNLAITGVTKLFNFLGKKSDGFLKEEKFVSAVRKANEILASKEYFKFIEEQLQEHICDDLFQELFQIRIVKVATSLFKYPNFDLQPDAKTFGYLALRVYAGNVTSINKDEFAEFQSRVYRSFSIFQTQKEDAENYEKTGFLKGKHAKQYKQRSIVGKAFYNGLAYVSINFGEFIRNLSKESELADKAEEILENSNIKKLLCSKFDNEFSENFFEEELEAEIVRVITKTLLNIDLHTNFEIEKDERLFKLIVQTVLDEGIVKFCSKCN